MKKNAIKFLYAIDCYLLYLLSGVISSLLVVVYYSLTAAKDNGGLGAQLDANTFSEYISYAISGKASAVLLLSYFLVLITVAAVFLFKKSSMSAYTGLSYCKPLSLIGSILLGALLNLFISSFVPALEAEPVEITLILVLCIILGPFVEELMFRGILLKMLGASVGVILSIFITSVLFAISHGNILQAGYTLILGLVLGVVRYKSTSLWSAIAIHTSFNITGAVLSSSDLVLSTWQNSLLLLLAVAAFVLSCTGGRKYAQKKNDNK